MIALAILISAAASMPCDSVMSLSTPQTAIASAELVPEGPVAAPGAPPAGGRGAAPTPGGRGAAPGGRGGGIPPGLGPTPPTLPAHCKVVMTLKPTSDSNILVELWLPTEHWNGKFLAVGNGGFAGAIQGYGDMQSALRLGYATAGTDTGHTGADGMFGLGHPEKIVDFAYRAVHEMTAKSKEIVNTFYGRGVALSYFKGCSTGGREAVMSAQRFPLDFDGIIAGALANRHIQMHTAGFARQVNSARHPEQALSPAKAKLVNDAVMQKCDTMHEGFLNNPRECSFDFSTLVCNGAESDACLTRPQLQAVEGFYGGVKNGKGELIFSGQALGNPILPSRGGSPTSVIDTVRIWGFENPDYDWQTFDLDRDMPIINKKVGFVDAVDPDLSAFKAHGGKLLMYAGWADTGITPENTVLYYESVLGKMGKSQDDWMRLFMVPGMGHCGGGPGVNSFDTIGTLDYWREKGGAPAQITAANAQTAMSRPLCPYPHYAKYKGTGNVRDAANWSCVAPR